jgi:hypothetical protein
MVMPAMAERQLPVEGILQHWSLAPRSPSSDPMRPLAQSAFVHKNYGSALAGALFFNFRPAHPFPLQYRRFIALRGTARRSLATPAQRMQNPPDMSGMILLPRLPLDQISHAPSGPKRGAVTESFGTGFQSLAQLLQLNWLQAGLAACARRLNECFGSLFLPGSMPTADRLAVNAQSPSDFPFEGSLGQKASRL